MKYFACMLLVLAVMAVGGEGAVVKRSLAGLLDIGRSIVGAVLGHRGESSLGLPYAADRDDGTPTEFVTEPNNIIVNIPGGPRYGVYQFPN